MADAPEVPPYRRVADELRARIRAHEFDGLDEKGKRKSLPGGKEIAETYGVTESTARRALNLLRADGVVDVHQGAGTYVRQWKQILRDANKRLSAGQWGTGRSIWDADIKDRNLVPEDVKVYRIKPAKDVPTFVADALGTRKVLVRDRVYTVDGRRVMWARSYLPLDIVAGTRIEDPDTGEGGTFARLAELGFAPELFTEDLEARRPTPDELEKLRINLGEPVARVVRLNTTAEGRIVEVTDMTAVGEAYVFRWSFTS